MGTYKPDHNDYDIGDCIHGRFVGVVGISEDDAANSIKKWDIHGIQYDSFKNEEAQEIWDLAHSKQKMAVDEVKDGQVEEEIEQYNWLNMTEKEGLVDCRGDINVQPWYGQFRGHVQERQNIFDIIHGVKCLYSCQIPYEEPPGARNADN